MPIIVLVLGILSVVGFGCLTGLPAWLLGNNALRDAKAQGWPDNDVTMIQVGRIIGMVVTILSIFGVCVWLMFVGGMLGAIGISGANS